MEYLALFRRAEPAHPERELLRAVLADGIRTLLKDDKAAGRSSLSTQRQQREALAWIVSEDRANLFSFERVCETLGIDAGWLRARLLAREPVG